MSAKTVALFTPSLRMGGAERVVVSLANGFARAGEKVQVWLATAEGELLSSLRADVRVIDLGAPGVGRALFALSKLLCAVSPDILLSAQSHANLVALGALMLARAPTKIVLTEHSSMSINFGMNPELKNRLVPRLAKLLYPRADAIVCNSQGVADDLLATVGVDARKVHRIYNPVIPDDFDEKLRAPLSHPWFDAGAPPVILAVGRLTAAKDYPTLLRAFSLVREKRPARLLILGEGEARSELEALVNTLGLTDAVQLPGFVDNPYPYMAHCAVFVLSSAWEGLSNVLVEALAAGAPIVSTDCKYGPSEVLENGRYGKLVPVGDAPALANALLDSLNQKCDSSTLRTYGREFSDERAIEQYLALFHSLV